MIISLGKRFDMTLLYRYYGVNYNPIYSRSFAAGSKAQNEQGLYLASSYAPSKQIKVDAALDIYHHPWLQYRQSNTSCNYDALLQCSYLPNKKSAFLIRLKHSSGSVDLTSAEQKISDPIAMWQELLGNRMENVWVLQSGKPTEYGMLLAQDISWKYPKAHLNIAARIAYFQTGGYNSRIYAHEPDLAFSYSMPVFQGKGYRYSIQVAYRFRRYLDLSIRWAQGFDAANPSAISSKDLKFQTFINF
jgi:hypothetical protein